MNKCRACPVQADSVVSFGKMPIANNFLSQNDFDEEYFFELEVLFCPSCKTFQLKDQPLPEKMFHENYAFFSGTSKKMATHFEKMAFTYLDKYIQNSAEAFIVELGSNDGIMLQNFAQKGIKHLGVEPSLNVATVAREKGVNTLVSFFGEETAGEIVQKYGQADIICGANVMCHIPDLSSVARGVLLLLKKNGVFVFEEPYLGDMVCKTSYDQIYDEHVYMFSLESVKNIFEPYGFQVFHVESQETHGGSMRYYLCFQGERVVQDSVLKQLQVEQELGLSELQTYVEFGKACQKSREDLIKLLTDLKNAGKRVVGYAATSKSTTILNYCQIGSDLIEYISDTTPVKQGKYSPGMHIPIKPYQAFTSDVPDYAVLFAWNHAQEIFEKEEDFIKRGGRWITFIPEVKVVDLT